MDNPEIKERLKKNVFKPCKMIPTSLEFPKLCVLLPSRFPTPAHPPSQTPVVTFTAPFRLSYPECDPTTPSHLFRSPGSPAPAQ